MDESVKAMVGSGVRSASRVELAAESRSETSSGPAGGSKSFSDDAPGYGTQTDRRHVGIRAWSGQFERSRKEPSGAQGGFS